MPLLPYIFASIAYLTGELDWHILRIAASLSAVATTCLAFWFLLSRTTWFVATCSLVMLTTSPLFFPWVITVQTYSITAPFLLISVLITETLRKSNVSREASPTDTLLVLLAGASLSMATQTRLYSVTLLPILYLYTPPRLKTWFLISFSVCCIPAIGLFISDPNQFLFNNIGYHLSRAHTPVARQISGKLRMLLILLGALPSRKFIGINTILLFWVGIGGTITLMKTIPVIALASLMLSFISFVPSPSYFQYFSLIVPFWAITFGIQLFKIIKTPIGQCLHLSRILPMSIVLLSLIGFDTNLEKYLQSGNGVMGIPQYSDPTNFSINATEKVIDKINARFGPDDIVFANWNGYLLNVKANPFPGSENIFGIKTASRFPAISEKQHLASYESILSALEQGKISGIVIRKKFERNNLQMQLAIKKKKCTLST